MCRMVLYYTVILFVLSAAFVVCRISRWVLCLYIGDLVLMQVGPLLLNNKLIELSTARHVRQSTNPAMRLSHASMNHTQQQQQQPQQSHVHHGHLSPKQQHHHHQQQASQQQCQMMAAGHPHHGGGAGAGTPRPSPSEHFICIELQKLHKEKERLHHQQEAINCRVQSLKPYQS